MAGLPLRAPASFRDTGIFTHGGSFKKADPLEYYDSVHDVVVPSTSNSYRVYEAGGRGPTLFLLHGGGHTSMRIAKNECHIIAPDFRGHGGSHTDNDSDLSVETLTNDTISLINLLVNKDKPLIVIGHSMGGAIAVHACKQGAFPNLKGMVVLDVVEGTAIPALRHMMGILNNRPDHFSSYQEAIDWSLFSGGLGNHASVSISVPDQLVERDGLYYWITNLKSSEPYWMGWYQGLSELFISVPATKLLILAGTDRLDKTLTIGQMQGKYQLVILPGVGHSLHEDTPDEFFRNIHRFLARNGYLDGGDEELKAKLERARQMLHAQAK